MDSSPSVNLPFSLFNASSTPTTLFLVMSGTPSRECVGRPVTWSTVPKKRSSSWASVMRTALRLITIQPAMLPSSGTTSPRMVGSSRLVATWKYNCRVRLSYSRIEAASDPLTSAAARTIRCSRMSRSRVEARSRAISIRRRYPPSRSVLISAMVYPFCNGGHDFGHISLQDDVGAHAQIGGRVVDDRSEEHTSELQSPTNLVCRLLL